MKRFVFVGISIIFLLFVVSCKQDEVDKQLENDDVEQPNQSTDVEDPGEDKQEKEAEDDEKKNIDPNVFITGEVRVDDDQIIVRGESNAPKGTTIHSSGTTLTSGWQNMKFIDQAKVKADGTFEFTFPSVGLYTTVTLSLSNNDQTTEVYGEHMEYVTGSQIYMKSDKNKFEVKTEFLLYPFREKPYILSLDVPDWEKPDDYGENDIWMDVDYTTDHFFIILKGESNLVEGTLLGGHLYNGTGQIEPSSHDHTYVNPDGSFTLRVPYDSLRTGLYLPIRVEPSQNSWENPIEHYGEEGENFQGDLVQENGQERYIEYIVDLEGPEFDVPEDVDLTQEEEEVKIQVPDHLLFDFDTSELKQDAKATLDQVLQDLEALSERTKIEINGHTDNEEEPDYNVTLSEERAQSVVNYLEENGEIDHLIIALHGYGEEKPIAPNDEEEGRAKNRRVEIVINPD